MPTLKLTTAQVWLAHTLEMLALGAIVAGGIAGYQMVVTGTYDWQLILSVIVAAAFAVLAKGFSSTMLGNVNLIPAIMDTLKELQDAANASQAPQGPLHVVVHSETPPAPIATTAPPQPQLESLQAFKREAQNYAQNYKDYAQIYSTTPAPPEPQPIILPTPAKQVPQVPFPDYTGSAPQTYMGSVPGTAIQNMGIPIHFGDTASVPIVQP